jgi:hypothetical protein
MTFSTPLPHRVFRQTQSASHANTFEKHRNDSGPKRGRNQDGLSVGSMSDPFSAILLPTMGNGRSSGELWFSFVTDIMMLTCIFFQDDTTAPMSPLSEGSPELSSDDDPHLGQVTPHHLISPAPRRVRDNFDDPPSDDSTMSTSPSQDAVTRRLQRSETLGSLKPFIVAL